MVKTSLKILTLFGMMVITWLSITSINSNAVNAIEQLQQQQNSSSVKVAAGGGNGTGPFTVFYPKNIEIKAGQSVTWSNPTTVGEPHTVTFVLDNNTMAGVVSPLAILNTTKFISLPFGSNNAPILLPGKLEQIP
jgi:plastocyanin